MFQLWIWIWFKSEESENIRICCEQNVRCTIYWDHHRRHLYHFMLISSSSGWCWWWRSLVTHHSSPSSSSLQMSSYIYQDKKWIQLVHVSKQKTKHQLLWAYIPQQWAVKAHLGMPRPTKTCQADGNECILGWGIHPRYTLNKRLFPLFVQDSSQVLTLPKSLEIVTETMDNVDSRQNACMINIHMTPIGGM